MPGSAGTDRARQAESTTGVSRTTVASRLRAAVTTAARAKTPVNSSAGFPPLHRPTRCAAAVKTPARAQMSDTTRIVTRNATTGARSVTAERTSAEVSSPVASVTPAHPSPTSASTLPDGCTNATASIPASASTTTTSDRGGTGAA